MTDVRPAASLLPVLHEGKPDARGWLYRKATFLGLWLLVGLVIMLLEPTDARQLARGLIFVIVGFSLNVLIGYAGQVSLGHQAFVGVGAFTSGLIVKDNAEVFWIAIFVSMLTGAIAAVLLGMVALRLKGLYLALVTLSYGHITEVVIFGIPALTGGGAGVQAARPPGFDGDAAFALLCLAFVALVFYVDVRFVRSRAGRAVMTIQENEIVAASFGVNVVGYKLLAFVLSGAIAGMAGSLFMHLTGSIAPTDFDFTLALTFVSMVVVGGVRSRGGIFIAGVFFGVLDYLVTEKLAGLMDAIAGIPPAIVFERFFGPEGRPYLPTFIGAVLLLVTLIQFPGGIGQQIRPVTEWLRGGRFTLKHHHGGGVQAGGAGVRP